MLRFPYSKIRTLDTKVETAQDPMQWGRTLVLLEMLILHVENKSPCEHASC